MNCPKLLPIPGAVSRDRGIYDLRDAVLFLDGMHQGYATSNNSAHSDSVMTKIKKPKDQA